jgi:hypothetical protein
MKETTDNMSNSTPIRSIVISEMQRLAAEENKSLPSLTDELALLDSGLDSLGIAMLVARLEGTLNVDPFTDSSDFYFPVTLGDFIRAYESAVKSI